MLVKGNPYRKTKSEKLSFCGYRCKIHYLGGHCVVETLFRTNYIEIITCFLIYSPEGSFLFRGGEGGGGWGGWRIFEKNQQI